MSRIRAAFAAAVVCLGAPQRPAAADELTFDDAVRRTVGAHPELAVFVHSEAALQAQRERAAQRPALTLGIDVENALGTGTASGLNGIETTAALGSVLERGGKLSARLAVAERELDVLAFEREAKRLDLLAEVARRWLDVAAAERLRAVATDDVAQRTRIVDAAARRVNEGGAHASTRLHAEAGRARAETTLLRAQSGVGVAKRRLAALWGDRDVDFEVASGALDVLPDPEPVAAKLDALAGAPEIRRFATEARVREARLQLARTARSADVTWEVGVRRLEADDDWALIGGISVPFGDARRAAPAIRVAEAELAALELEREGRQRALEATLLEAAGRLEDAVLLARRIDTALLPKLEEAAASVEHAYRAGAASHVEWVQLRGELVEARRERVEAAVAAQRALIELQRLTGESFGTPGEDRS